VPKKIYQLTVVLEFEYGADRTEWLELFKSQQPTNNLTPNLVRYTSRLFFDSCRLCGIERKRGTLGSGMLGDPADECRATHAGSCNRRKEKKDGHTSD
jgi:hypothetical protein